MNEPYCIKFKHRPAVPGNIKHWQVFEDDKQINDFLKSENEFKISQSSLLEYAKENHDEEENHKTDLPSFADINLITHNAQTNEDLAQRDLEVLHCENDTIPRGLAPLEEIFYFNDVAKKPKMESTETDIEEYRSIIHM